MEPLGISYLAAMLCKENIPGVSVDIFEPSIEGDTIESTVLEIIKGDYNYIGLSFITDDTGVCKEFVDTYRSKGGRADIIVGGHGPSLTPEEFLIDGVKAVS